MTEIGLGRTLGLRICTSEVRERLEMKALKSAAGNSAKSGDWNPERPPDLERKD